MALLHYCRFEVVFGEGEESCAVYSELTRVAFGQEHASIGVALSRQKCKTGRDTTSSKDGKR
jgi:hypothetical protein